MKIKTFLLMMLLVVGGTGMLCIQAISMAKRDEEKYTQAETCIRSGYSVYIDNVETEFDPEKIRDYVSNSIIIDDEAKKIIIKTAETNK